MHSDFTRRSGLSRLRVVHNRRTQASAATLFLVLALLAGSTLAPARAGSPQSSDPTPHSILSDVRVRRAIAYCTEKDALVASVYPSLAPAERQALIMDTWIPSFSWAYTAPSTTYDYNPAAGQALLEAAGWVLLGGHEYRSKAPFGELTLALTTNDVAFRKTFLAVFESQMKACGIRLVLNPLAGTWFFGDITGLAVRDFEVAEFAWIGAEDVGGRELYACDKIPLPANGWRGQNQAGWCNTAASDALIRAADTARTRPERKLDYATVIDEMAKDVPALYLFMRSPVDPAAPVMEHIDFNLQTFSETMLVQPLADTNATFTDFASDIVYLDVPNSSVPQPTTLVYSPLLEGIDPPDGPPAFKALRLSALIGGVPAPSTAFGKWVHVVTWYNDGEVREALLREDSLRLYMYKNGNWQDATLTCPEATRLNEVLTGTNKVRANVCELGEFTVRGVAQRWLYLPLIRR